MREEAVRFGTNNYLTGVVTTPDKPANAPAILLLNAGMIHHVGPSRIYVRLARRLAQLGFTTLRFDFSGIGDSCARQDNLGLEAAVIDDTGQAMDFLSEYTGTGHFILMGHCAGAWISFLTASRDSRVRGTVLMNPEGAGDEWNEYDRQRKISRFYQQYYSREAITDPERWKKLLTGRANYGSIAKNVVKNILWNRISTVAFKVRHKFDNGTQDQTSEDRSLRDQIVRAFVEQRIRMLLLFSEGSSAIEYTHTVIGKELETMTAAGIVTEVVIPNADHTFTLLSGQQTLMEHIESWCATFLPETIPAH
jgi:pimeloyl-ACP methyl ester carboxylesterase